MSLFFNLAMIFVIPFWCLMIVLPRWHQTKRIISSPLIAIGPAIIYALVVIPRLPDVLSAFSPPTIDSLQTLLSTPSGVVITWAHFLAFDVFVGRWIYMNSRRHHLSPWLMAPILLLAFMLAPLGWLAYVLVRLLTTGGVSEDSVDTVSSESDDTHNNIRHAFLRPLHNLWRAGLAYWHKTSNAQRVLFITGTVLFAWMCAHIGLLIISNRPLDGPTSFRKAATFAETGWLMCWAVGYILPYLKTEARTRWLIVGGTWLFGAAETLLISIQVWRGVPSHYNFTTPLNSALFGTTGIIASIWLISMVILLMVILRDSRFEMPMRLACTAGTGLMIIGGVTGFMMLFNLSGVYQGNLTQNVQTLIQGDMLGSFTADVAGDAGGNLVVLHALGVHGLSVLSLLAWLLTYTTLSRRKQLILVITGIVTYTGLLVLLAVAAFRTIPLSELSYPLLAANGITGSLLLIVYGIALWRGVPALFDSFEQPAVTRTAI